MSSASHVTAAEARPAVLFVGGIDPVHDAFQAAAQDGERSAQFMGDVSQHLAALTIIPFHGIRHLVKTVT